MQGDSLCPQINAFPFFPLLNNVMISPSRTYECYNKEHSMFAQLQPAFPNRALSITGLQTGFYTCCFEWDLYAAGDIKNN